MKKIFSTMLFTAFISSVLVSQNNNLVVYSQDGLKFSLILNGIRQNNEPQTNVKVTGLNATNYQVKVIFANKMPDLDQNAYLMYSGEPTQNTEYTYSIANVKGKYKLKFKSAAPISEIVNTSAPEQTVVIYTPIERTTTTTTTTNSTGTNNNANIGMNVNGMGMSMNININDMDGGIGAGNSSSTTSSYSSTTTTTSNNTGMNQSNNTTYVLQGYNGVYGCPYPMGASDFESAKASIKAKSFDDSKLTLAKQIIGSNCMLCSQIKELMLLITFEATRLDLAKFAWSHNLDKGNYYKLNDAFTFESSIDELNEYTQSH
jgi:hypothetical protein